MANLRNKRGHYHAEFYDPNRQPKRKWIALRTKDKQAARQKLVRLEREYAMELYDPWEEGSPEQVLLVQEAKERFLSHKSDLRPRSLEKYESVIRLFAESLPPGTQLRDVEHGHIREYLTESELSKTSRHVYFKHLQAFFNWCEKSGLLANNPFEGKTAPQLPKKSPSFLTPEQVKRLLQEIDESVETNPRHRTGQCVWLKDVIVFAVSTGLRLGEICSLQWQDVTRSDTGSWITVRSRDQAETKSGHERRVPLVEAAEDVIERRAKASDSSGNDEHIFLSPTGIPLRRVYVSKRFLHYRRSAGLPEGISFHSLRHTCASWLVQRGVSLKIVQEILGHSTSAVTERYAHLAPDTIQNEMNRALAQRLDEGNVND